MTASVETLSGG